jgi:hypothetical protein
MSIILLFGVIQGVSSSWSIWNSGLNLAETLNPTSKRPEVNPIDEFIKNMQEVIDLRQTMVQYVSYVGERVASVPHDIIAASEKVDFHRRRFNEIIDCSDVDINRINVSADLIKEFENKLRYSRKDEPDFLKSIPKEIACWLMDSQLKKLEHKVVIKQRSSKRLKRIIEIAEEFIGQIETILISDNTQRSLNEFFNMHMGSFPTNLGRWALAVKDHMIARGRHEAIKKEIQYFRDLKLRRNLPAVNVPFPSEFHHFVNLHFTQGADIQIGKADSFIVRSLTEGVCSLPSFEVDKTIKEVLSRLSLEVGEIATLEQTASFDLLGESPVRQLGIRENP